MGLANDVAEVRIGREGGSLVEDRLAHDGLHRFALLVVPQLEVLTNLGVIDFLHARGAKSGVRKQWCELNNRQVIGGEDVEGIPQEFVRAGPEVLQSPTSLQHLGECRNPYEVRRVLVEWVETHGDDRIGRLNQDQTVAQVPMLGSFSGMNCPKQKDGSVSVKIDEEEAAICLDVLKRLIPEQETFAAPRLPQHGHVHRAPRRRHVHEVPGRLPVCYLETETERAALAPCSASAIPHAVPDRNQKFFEEVDHHERDCEGLRDKIGNGRKEKDPGALREGTWLEATNMLALRS